MLIAQRICVIVIKSFFSSIFIGYLSGPDHRDHQAMANVAEPGGSEVDQVPPRVSLHLTLLILTLD